MRGDANVAALSQNLPRPAARRKCLWLRRLLAPAAAAILSACAVGPDFKIPVAPEIPLTPKPLTAPGLAAGETQRFVQQLDIPGAWWMLFRSRDLDALIERALRENYDLKTAQAALRVAHANVAAQRGAFFPTVAGNYTATRQKVATGDLTSPTELGSPFFTLHTAELTISYVPDVFGLNRRQVESLEAQAEFNACNSRRRTSP